MRCLRASDWFEHHGDEPFDQEWEQVLVHSRSCPDCALLMKQRSSMFEAMGQMPVPQPPADLHSRILQAIEVDKGMGEGVDSNVNDWIDRLLPTFQFAVTTACILLAIGLLRPTPMKQGADALDERLRARASVPIAVVSPPQARTSAQQLVKLSPAEVSEFMKKLNDYRRQHPEMDIHQKPLLSSELAGFSGR